MRICIDISPAAHGRAGIGRYANELLQALLELEEQDDYSVFYNDAGRAALAPPLRDLPQIPIPHANKPWRLLVLLSYLLSRPQDRIFPGIQLFHATDNLLPYLSQARSVFTLHDLTHRIFPGAHTTWNRLYLSLLMDRFLERADRVIAVSDCTRVDALRFFSLDSQKIRVIYEGVHPRFRPLPQAEIEAARVRYSLPDRYWLFVGTIEPRKNLEILLETQAALQEKGWKFPLVIAGKRGWLAQSFFEKRERMDLEKQVLYTGFIPDGDLPAIYCGASVFVFPSLYEGFGLPVLEAMACGTPVVCSNTSSLPEITGQAALLVDPYKKEAFIQAIERLFTGADLRHELSERGLAQAARFSWRLAAEKTLAVYRELAE